MANRKKERIKKKKLSKNARANYQEKSSSDANLLRPYSYTHSLFYAFPPSL